MQTITEHAGALVIPDDVKQLVWLRDGGRCCHCGSDVELQFDHIIPRTMGGANVADNIQILCGPCNRKKGAGLTVRRGGNRPSAAPLTTSAQASNPHAYRHFVERTLWELAAVDTPDSARVFVTKVAEQVRDMSVKVPGSTANEFINTFKDAVVSSVQGETENGRRAISDANAEAAAASAELQARLDAARAANDLEAERAVWRERDVRQAACQAKIDAVQKRADSLQLRLGTVTDLLVATRAVSG